MRNNADCGKENQLDSTGPVDSVKKKNKTFKCISKVFKTQKLSVISNQHNPYSYFGLSKFLKGKSIHNRKK